MKFLLIPVLVSSIFATELPIDYIETITTQNKIEPSGIAINNGITYVISDNGRICNISIDSCVKLKKKIDMEGITFDNNNVMYVAQEGKDKLLKLSENLEISAKYKVPREYNGRIILKKGGDGIEALTYLYTKANRKFFIISNQSDYIDTEDGSTIIKISIPAKQTKFRSTARIENVYNMQYTDISGLFYKRGYLYVISDDNDKLLVYKENTMEQIEEYELPGEDQEGIFIKDNTLYIAQDSGNVLKIHLKFPI